MENIALKHREFLAAIKQEVKGKLTEHCNWEHIRASRRIDRDVASKIVDDLVEANYIERYKGLRRFVMITQLGLEYLRQPYNPTVNINVGSMNNSQIQAASSNSIQNSVVVIDDSIEKLKYLIDVLQQNLDRLELVGEVMRELKSDLESMKAQVYSPKPKTTVIKELSKSIRTILEGAASGAVGTIITNEIFPRLDSVIKVIS